jgi:DNA-binding IscR family transcriptional regulator
VGFSLAQPFMPDVSSIFGAHVVITGVGFVLLNRFLPYAEVRLSAAIAGGLVTALLFELGKFGFGVYVQQFAFRSYEGVYGPSLAILPVFVVWSQLSWMVVLLGAEVAFVMQHRKSIALLGYMNRYVLDRLAMQRPSGRTAARIMLAIADQYARRSIGQTADALAERFGLGLDTVTEILARLKRAELIAEVDEPRETLVPARPLEQIRVLDVMLLFDRDQARDARDDRLTRVFANFDRTRDRLMGQTTYRDLVDDERPPPQPDEAPEPGDETGVELDPRSGPRAVLPIDRD